LPLGAVFVGTDATCESFIAWAEQKGAIIVIPKSIIAARTMDSGPSTDPLDRSAA
jgi:hypothetical protein